ncbi:Protein of unknown function [Pyronema omphalodes CBS 100304]|uniref:Uncharacterized protein n=1 Tax=Pyronema omphalodes (strain CBS 100304) TaxID=1076935 RepID=U4L030_PYROM|nr:Protein of unknown function [Pyronema omphalodes CBS 100304]
MFSLNTQPPSSAINIWLRKESQGYPPISTSLRHATRPMNSSWTAGIPQKYCSRSAYKRWKWMTNGLRK